MFENRRYSMLMLLVISVLTFTGILVITAVNDNNHHDPAVFLAAIGFAGISFNQLISMARAEQSRNVIHQTVTSMDRKLNEIQTTAGVNQTASIDAIRGVPHEDLRQLISEVIEEHTFRVNEIVQQAIRDYHQAYHVKPEKLP